MNVEKISHNEFKALTNQIMKAEPVQFGLDMEDLSIWMVDGNFQQVTSMHKARYVYSSSMVNFSLMRIGNISGEVTLIETD